MTANKQNNPEQVTELTVSELQAPIRLDVWLVQQLPQYTRSHLQKFIQAQQTLVNGKHEKSSLLLKGGEHIRVALVDSELPASQLQPIAMSLDILYEDDSLLVLNKPAGISVHPGAGKREPTLVEGLIYHAQQDASEEEASEEDEETALFRPGVVHRLDKDTSGVMVYAKTVQAHAFLAAQFKDKTNLRSYIALLDGCMKEKTLCYESYLYRDPKQRLKFASMPLADFVQRYEDAQQAPKSFRWSKSQFTRLKTFAGRYTLAKIELFTGRTHQIRIHSEQLGLAVLGDPLYNRHTKNSVPKSFGPELARCVAALGRQMLHAQILGFKHPQTGAELVFEASPPPDFSELLSLLEPYTDERP